MFSTDITITEVSIAFRKRNKKKQYINVQSLYLCFAQTKEKRPKMNGMKMKTDHKHIASGF